MTLASQSTAITDADPSRRGAPIIADTATTLVLGPRTAMTGILQVQGSLRIDGSCDADVRCGFLLVSATALVDGVLVAERIEIDGRVAGQVYANEVVLRRGCHVEAELYFRTLSLEVGAFFEGRSRQHELPLSLGPHFPPAAWSAPESS